MASNFLFGSIRLNWILLDVAVLPFAIVLYPISFFGKRALLKTRQWNAYAHIHFVCRACPQKRRHLRDPEGGSHCLWNANWHAGNFDIPRDFGFQNWLSQYIHQKTDLETFRNYILSPSPNPNMSLPNQKTVLFVTSSILFWILTSSFAFAIGPRWEYFVESPDIECSWKDLGTVPLADKKYPPQGMTYWNGYLVFTNHWKDTASAIYKLDPATMEILVEAKLSEEASHTSGLAFDGTHVWAVDYNSNQLYQFDIEKTFDEKKVVILAAYPTGLKGTSAMTFVKWKDRSFFAISDFFHSGKTYLIETHLIPQLQTRSIVELAEFQYHNEWFSQGVTWDGTYLYESINNRGIDRIRVLWLDAWLEGKVDEPCEVIELDFGGSAAEDLANDGTTMWSSDEHSYQFLRLNNYRTYIPKHNCPQ